ncbi:unnamed protein product, partial [Prorocentrum cordatum]
ASGQHYEGLASAARNSNCLSPACKSQLIKIDYAYNLVRHITHASVGLFTGEVASDTKGQGKWRAKKQWAQRGHMGSQVHSTRATSESSGGEDVVEVAGGAHIGIEAATLVKQEAVIFDTAGTQTEETEPPIYDVIMARLYELQDITMETRADVLSLSTKGQHVVQQEVHQASDNIVSEGMQDSFVQRDEGLFKSDASTTADMPHYVMISASGKNRQLIDILRKSEAGQFFIYTRSRPRTLALQGLLERSGFAPEGLCEVGSATDLVSDSSSDASAEMEEETNNSYTGFKALGHSTGVSFAKPTCYVINYDMPVDLDSYMHRVGPEACQGCQVLDVITFTVEENEVMVLQEMLGCSKADAIRECCDQPGKTTRAEYVELHVADTVGAALAQLRGQVAERLLQATDDGAATTLKRAEKLFTFFDRAVEALVGEGLVSEAMTRGFWPATVATEAGLQAGLQDTSNDLVAAVKRHLGRDPRQSVPGPNGGRFERWRALLKYSTALGAVAKVTVLFLCGKLSPEAMRANLSARLVAFRKRNGDLRPIGDRLEAPVAAVCCAASQPRQRAAPPRSRDILASEVWGSRGCSSTRRSEAQEPSLWLGGEGSQTFSTHALGTFAHDVGGERNASDLSLGVNVTSSSSRHPGLGELKTSWRAQDILASEVWGGRGCSSTRQSEAQEPSLRWASAVRLHLHRGPDGQAPEGQDRNLEVPPPRAGPGLQRGPAACTAAAHPKFQGDLVGAKEGRGRVSHARAPLQTKQINTAYAHWVAALEIAFLETHAVPAEERAKYQGRAQGYQTAHQVMMATPGRAHRHDPVASWWQNFGALPQSYAALAKNGRDVKERESIARRAQAMLIQVGRNDDHKKYFGPKGDPTEAEERKLQVAPLDFCDEHDLDHICAITQRGQHGATARAAGRARKRCLDWAKRAWKEPPGKLHRAAKDPGPPKLETKLHGVTFADPYTVMNGAGSAWRQIWTTNSHGEHQIMQAYLEAMRRARGGPLPCIEPQHIYVVVRVAAELEVSPKTAVIASSAAVALNVHTYLKRAGVRPCRPQRERSLDVVSQPPAILGDKGPGIELRRQTILEWLNFCFANPNYHQRIRKTWRVIYTKVTCSSTRRWRQVMGPISAVQAILLDAGWDCPSPFEWSRQPREGEQGEQTWPLPRKDCGDGEQRREQVDPSQLALEFCQSIESGYCPRLHWLALRAVALPPVRARTRYFEIWGGTVGGAGLGGTVAGAAHVLWVPSHIEGAASVARDPVAFARTLGSACADAWAGEAARRAWDAAVVGAAPPTDLHDAQCALIRRRARRALADTLAVDPRVAERPSQAEGQRATPLQRASSASPHSYVLHSSKYRCSSCGVTVDKAQIRPACATPCQPVAPQPVASDQVAPAQGAATLCGRELHSSHKLHFSQKCCMYFCRECGKTATEDPRHLASPCGGLTRKGKDNLAKIDKGLFTRARAGRDSLAPYIRAASHGMAVEQEVQWLRTATADTIQCCSLLSILHLSLPPLRSTRRGSTSTE